MRVSPFSVFLLSACALLSAQQSTHAMSAPMAAPISATSPFPAASQWILLEFSNDPAAPNDLVLSNLTAYTADGNLFNNWEIPAGKVLVLTDIALSYQFTAPVHDRLSVFSMSKADHSYTWDTQILNVNAEGTFPVGAVHQALATPLFFTSTRHPAVRHLSAWPLNFPGGTRITAWGYLVSH